jgi:hypothetical protein
VLVAGLLFIAVVVGLVLLVAGAGIARRILHLLRRDRRR